MLKIKWRMENMFGVTCKAGSQYGVTPMNEWEGGGGICLCTW